MIWNKNKFEEIINKLNIIDEEIYAIKAKYDYPYTWTKKDTKRVAYLRKRQKEIIGIRNDDVLTVSKLCLLIKRILEEINV